MHLPSVVESRNSRDHLMALATLFDIIVPLIFYYQSYLPPMATLMTWLRKPLFSFFKIVYGLHSHRNSPGSCW